ncbi:hypothetical protein CYY_009773, partial [Polysphondylium violaceum]
VDKFIKEKGEESILNSRKRKQEDAKIKANNKKQKVTINKPSIVVVPQNDSKHKVTKTVINKPTVATQPEHKVANKIVKQDTNSKTNQPATKSVVVVNKTVASQNVSSTANTNNPKNVIVNRSANVSVAPRKNYSNIKFNNKYMAIGKPTTKGMLVPLPSNHK